MKKEYKKPEIKKTKNTKVRGTCCFVNKHARQ